MCAPLKDKQPPEANVFVCSGPIMTAPVGGSIATDGRDSGWSVLLQFRGVGREILEPFDVRHSKRVHLAGTRDCKNATALKPVVSRALDQSEATTAHTRRHVKTSSVGLVLVANNRSCGGPSRINLLRLRRR